MAGGIEYAINKLLEDRHTNVKWGEEIPGVEDMCKIGTGTFRDSELWGKLFVSLREPVDVALLESILRDDEKLVEGSEGTLTSTSYTPIEYYIYREQRGERSVTQTRLMTVRIRDRSLSAPIYVKNGDLRMDPRAVEILKTYLDSVEAKSL